MIAAVSLKKIEENARLIKEYAKAPLIAVVKDDAYGHGAIRVAHALKGVADLFAVATAAEGAELRIGGVEKDILVLSPALTRQEGITILSYGLIASISSLASFRVLKRAEDIAGQKCRAHLAVNTGMNRYGVRPELVSYVCREAGERIEGVYSHLYTPQNARSVKAQKKLFLQAADEVKSFVPTALPHLSATGGILSGCVVGAVRAGIALYGYLPEGMSGIAVKPAMRIYAKISQRTAHFGGGVGYMVAKKDYATLNTYRLGYGDGFFRSTGLGEGCLCMDAFMKEGGGRFGDTRLILKDVSAYARAHGTTPYEVLVAIGSRAERRYDRG